MVAKMSRALSLGGFECIEGESGEDPMMERGADLIGLFFFFFRSLETKENLAALLVKDLL